MRCKVKLRQQARRGQEGVVPGGQEARVPGLLVDAVVKETASITVTRDQLSALAHITTAFQANIRNRCHNCTGSSLAIVEK